MQYKYEFKYVLKKKFHTDGLKLNENFKQYSKVVAFIES